MFRSEKIYSLCKHEGCSGSVSEIFDTFDGHHYQCDHGHDWTEDDGFRASLGKLSDFLESLSGGKRG